MLSVFQRAAQGVLSVLGQDSLLRSTVPCKVNIEHGVQVVGDDGVTVLEKKVATIGSEHNPKVGDTLSHPDGNFKLDVLFQDSGVTKRFILVKTGV